MEAGIDLLTVQKILGHSTLSTTLLYTYVWRHRLKIAGQAVDSALNLCFLGSTPQHSVGEIIRRHALAYLDRHGDHVTPQQRKTSARLAACRTAAMGGRIHICSSCRMTTPIYNSCGDRHCPQCQGGQRAAWFAA